MNNHLTNKPLSGLTHTFRLREFPRGKLDCGMGKVIFHAFEAKNINNAKITITLTANIFILTSLHLLPQNPERVITGFMSEQS